jgi:hypothetical protein
VIDVMGTLNIRAVLCLVMATAITGSTTGCFVVEVAAPYGPDVKVLPPDVPVEVTRRYQKWYAIWGIFALSANDPKSIIAEERLVEARISTADSVEDVISGFVYFFLFPAGILVPQTVVVEGNRVPLDDRGIPVGNPEPGEPPGT